MARTRGGGDGGATPIVARKSPRRRFAPVARRRRRRGRRRTRRSTRRGVTPRRRRGGDGTTRDGRRGGEGRRARRGGDGARGGVRRGGGDEKASRGIGRTSSGRRRRRTHRDGARATRRARRRASEREEGNPAEDGSRRGGVERGSGRGGVERVRSSSFERDDDDVVSSKFRAFPRRRAVEARRWVRRARRVHHTLRNEDDAETYTVGRFASARFEPEKAGTGVAIRGRRREPPELRRRAHDPPGSGGVARARARGGGRGGRGGGKGGGGSGGGAGRIAAGRVRGETIETRGVGGKVARGGVAVAPGGVEHRGWLSRETEIDPRGRIAVVHERVAETPPVPVGSFSGGDNLRAAPRRVVSSPHHVADDGTVAARDDSARRASARFTNARETAATTPHRARVPKRFSVARAARRSAILGEEATTTRARARGMVLSRPGRGKPDDGS